jgi:hypothetical protein
MIFIQSAGAARVRDTLPEMLVPEFSGDCAAGDSITAVLPAYRARQRMIDIVPATVKVSA